MWRTKADTRDRAVLWRYAVLLRCECRLFGAVAATMILLSLLQLPGPLLSMRVIDAVNRPEPGPPPGWMIHLLCGALLATVLVARGVHVIQRWVLEKFRYRLTFRIQRDLFDHLLRLPLPYHLARSHGYLLSRVNEDPVHLQGLMANTVLSVLGDLMTLVVGLGFLFWVHWRLALLAVIILPPLVVLFVRLRTALKEDFKESQERSAVVNRHLAEHLANVLTIKAFTLEAQARRRFARAMVDLIRQRFTILRKRVTYETIIALLSGLVPIGILWIAAFEIVAGRLTVGEFIAFNGFLAYLYRPAEGIVIALLSMQNSVSAVERVFEILDTRTEGDAGRPRPVGPPPLAFPVPVALESPALELRRVAFRYPGERDWVLRDVSFTIERGEAVAITGPSGMGKTTLLNLVPRLLEPVEGTVLVGGIDHAAFPLRELRRRVTLVSLETRLLAGSVTDNVRCGVIGATAAAIRDAACAACADEFIVRLPGAYAAELEEAGSNLSAGQRQRLLLARAVLRRPEILILDEATSFLNTELEERVLAHLRLALPGCTIICVSHRPTVLKFADRRFLLDHACLVEDEPFGRSACGERSSPARPHARRSAVALISR